MTQKPMTKSQLVASLAETMGSDKASANRMVDALCGIITKEVAGGGAVTLPGVGKIYCRARPERMVRNPQTNEEIFVPAHKKTHFKPGKILKQYLSRPIK